MIKTKCKTFTDIQEFYDYGKKSGKEFLRMMYGESFYVKTSYSTIRIYIDNPGDKIEIEERIWQKSDKAVFSGRMIQDSYNQEKSDLFVSYGIIADKRLYDGAFWISLNSVIPPNADKYYMLNTYYVDEFQIISSGFELLSSDITTRHPLPYSKLYILNIDKQEQLEKDFPYAAPIFSEAGIPAELAYTFPEIEILYKAGYLNICNLITNTYTRNDESDLNKLNQILHHGTDPKSIFDISKDFCQIIRDNNLNIYALAELKKIKKYKITAELAKRYIDAGLFEKASQFQRIKRILRFKFAGKTVYTPETLINYLNRTYMYEALEYNDALINLDDYLQSCKILNMAPNSDSDSLLREHNVAARLVREKMAEEDKKNNSTMMKVCEFWQRFDWNNGIYFIRSIRSITDLIEESRMQRNCVASYRERIIKGISAIFVMRSCAAPEKSLITVEYSPRSKQIVQALLGANQHINDFGQKQFIQDWAEAIRDGKTDDWTILPEELSYEEKCRMQDEIYRKIAIEY